MSFFSSLFGGSNPTLNSQIGTLGSVGSFGVNLGEKDLNASSNFYNSILSGDQSRIGQVLAPEIQQQQQQAQQQKQTTSQFGNRSGGNNSSMQMVDDKAKSNINNLVSSLLGTSASGLAGIGSGSLSQGLGAYQQQAGDSQMQKQNWENSIFGMGIGQTAGAGVTKGLKSLGF